MRFASTTPESRHSAKGRNLAEYRWPSEEAKNWTCGFVARAAQLEQTLAIVLIGSMVRATPKINDVDLFYVYRTDSVSFRDHPFDVDIRAFSALEILEKLHERHDLTIWALEYGHLIYEQDSFWSDITRNFKKKPVLPSANRALERAVKAERRWREMKELGDAAAAAEMQIGALTHRAWYHLLSDGVLPPSRAELPALLQSLGCHILAAQLEKALRDRRSGSGGEVASTTRG